MTSATLESRFLLWAITSLICCTACQRVAAQERTPVAEKVIHSEFAKDLKNAAQGTPLIIEDNQKAIQIAIDKQIQVFVDKASKSDDKAAQEAAEKTRDSMGIHDEITLALTYELESSTMPTMEKSSFRETLDDLGIHLKFDYTIAVGAIPDDFHQVRVSMPTFHACGGCKQKVEETLNSTGGFQDAIVDMDTFTLQFLIQSDMDVEEKLNALEKSGLIQIKGWKRIR